jgi:hypothetical protein
MLERADSSGRSVTAVSRRTGFSHAACEIDHRLDREEHAGLQHHASPGRPIWMMFGSS